MDVLSFKFAAMMMVIHGVVGAQGAGVANQDLTTDVNTTLKAFEKAYSANNIRGMLDCHTEDLQVMPPGQQMITTKEEFVVMIERYIEKYLEISFKIVDIDAICADSVVTQLNYTLSPAVDSNAEKLNGETVVLWKREAGKMKIFWSIWAPDKEEKLGTSEAQ